MGGGTVPAVKHMFSAILLLLVLKGTTGMTVSDKMVCLLEDLGNSFEESKGTPLHDVGE